MSNRKLGYLLLLPSLLIGLVLFNANSRTALSASAQSVISHVVISEVMTGEAGTGNADKEFIELYNPTSSSMNITGWKLTRKTDSGTQSTLVASMSGTIAPKSYLLVGSPEYSGTVSADLTYSTTQHIASDNTVLLYGSDGTTLLDKVGMGDATDSEATAAANPASGTSIERKANSSSTSQTMAIGGSDALNGNGEDTNNNGSDFVLRSVPQPQNSSSSVEPFMTSPSPSATSSASPSASASATPTASPTVAPTATPTASPIMTPTPTPSPTASPTIAPTATPTPTASPTMQPTATPTSTPTMSPTPSASASATPTASPTMTPTPLPIPSPTTIASWTIFNQTNRCVLSYQQLNFGFFRVNIPAVSCGPVQL